MPIRRSAGRRCATWPTRPRCRRRRAGARGGRGLGRPAPGAPGRRRPVGGRRALPRPRRPAVPVARARRASRGPRRRSAWCCSATSAWMPTIRGSAGRGGRPRQRPLGARRPAVLRGRGRAVHQRPDRGPGRVLRAGRGPAWSIACSASSSRTAAGTARPRTARCARRSTPRSACSRGSSRTSRRPVDSATIASAPAAGRGVPARAAAAPPHEHR